MKSQAIWSQVGSIDHIKHSKSIQKKSVSEVHIYGNLALCQFVDSRCMYFKETNYESRRYEVDFDKFFRYIKSSVNQFSASRCAKRKVDSVTV